MWPLARLYGPIGWRRLHSRATDALRRIQQLNGEINAVVHSIERGTQTRLHKTDHDKDRKDSNATDHGIPPIGGVGNTARDAFDGIPILVKDSIHVQGMPTVCGDAARKSHVAPEDAPLIARRTCCWPASACVFALVRNRETETVRLQCGVRAQRLSARQMFLPCASTCRPSTKCMALLTTPTTCLVRLAAARGALLRLSHQVWSRSPSVRTWRVRSAYQPPSAEFPRSSPLPGGSPRPDMYQTWRACRIT